LGWGAVALSSLSGRGAAQAEVAAGGGSPSAKPHDVGAIFGKGNKSYFPMMLANGIDHVLVGYSGSMGACQAHEAWNYPNMNMETITGWYRFDIRRRPVYFVQNLLQCGYIVRRGVHADGIESAVQRFDALRAVLDTRCQMGYAEVHVSTFLTRSHWLVHRFSVSAHADDMAMQFFVRTPSVSALRVEVSRAASRPGGLDFAVVGDGWPATPGRLVCDHPEAKRVACYNGQAGLEVPLRGQSEFTFAIQCALIQDVPGGADREELHSEFNHATVLERHSAEWEKFSSHSAISLPHRGIDDVYRTSLYVIRAHQHPVLGGINLGGYPDMWNNGVCPSDMSFSMLALMGANRLEEAERGVRFWKRSLPHLTKLVREAGLPHGVAAPWDLSVSGEGTPVSREQILEMKHLETAQISLQTWQLYQYSGRLSVLKEYWDCLVQPLEFLLGHCVEEFDDHAEIIRSSGPNGKERVDGKVVYYPNPTFSLLTTIEALRGACEAANLLGREIPPRWRQILPKLERGIERNRFEGVIREARHPRANITEAGSQVGLFDARLDKETVLANTRRKSSREGFPTWTNHGYRAVPWVMCDSSAAFSRLGIEGAGHYVELATLFTTTLNGFPEAIRPDGVYVKTWYPTVHGDFVHAVHLLLVRRRQDVVELFAGVPDDWGPVSFQSLRAPVGLVVSASRKDKQITAKVVNDSDRRQQFKLAARGDGAWEESVALEPGEAVSLPRSR
jgi:hypothetical protein